MAVACDLLSLMQDETRNERTAFISPLQPQPRQRDSLMIMALEVAAAIIGILAAASKVAETLGPYILAWKHAPQNATAVLYEVNASRICLSALQGLLDDLESTPYRRKTLIQIDQLIATFTDGVLLFSELEAIILNINENRTQWVWKDKELAALVSRLQCFKSSISFMLNILQCGSDQEAIHSRQELLSITSSLLQSNLDLSQRMARLENRLIRDDSVLTSRPASFCTTSTHLQDEHSTESSKIKWKTHLSARWLFEFDLIASKVYQKAKRSTCDASFNSSIAVSDAWSALSEISLSDISAISVVALPLDWTEISNRQHYSFYDIPISSEPVEPLKGTDRRYSSSSSTTTIKEFQPSIRFRFVMYAAKDTGAEGLTTIWTEPRVESSPNIYASVCSRPTFHFSDEWPIGDHMVLLDIDVVYDFPTVYGNIPIVGDDTYIRHGELFMLIFSVKSPDSLHNIVLHHTHITRKKGDTWRYPIAIIANHCDLWLNWSERATLEQGKSLAHLLGCKFYQVSEDYPSTIRSAIRELIQLKWDIERKDHNEMENQRISLESRYGGDISAR